MGRAVSRRVRRPRPPGVGFGAGVGVTRRQFLRYSGSAGALFAAGGAGALLAACGPSEDPVEAEPGEDFTGQLGLLLGSHMGPVMQLAQQYQQEHGVDPDIEEVTTPDLRNVLTTAFLAQDSPWDAAFTIAETAQEMADRQWALGASAFIDEAVRPTGEVFAGSLRAVEFEGDIWAVPWTVGAPIMHWNRAMFEDVGLDPDAPASWHAEADSWDTFVEYAQELTGARNGTEYYGFTDAWAEDHVLYTWGSLLQMHGGRFLNEELQPVFNDESGVEATMKMYDLLHTHQVVDPAVRTYTWVFDASPGFLNGTRGIFFTWPFVAGLTQDPDESDIEGQADFAPQPAVDTSASVDGSEYLFVPRFAENPDEAWRFLELLTSLDGQRIVAADGWAPIYEELATDEQNLDTFPFYEAVAQSYEYPVDGGFSPDRALWADILANEIAEVFDDQKDAQEALDDAVRLIEQERES